MCFFARAAKNRLCTGFCSRDAHCSTIKCISCLHTQGPNLLKLARKEQCLALLTQLRSKFKLNGQFYRVFPNGEVSVQAVD